MVLTTDNQEAGGNGASPAATTTETTRNTNESSNTAVAMAEEEEGEEGVNGEVEQRMGTVSSARFNILSTMVGGGCLSLPMAFDESGSLGPIVLIVIGLISELNFNQLIASGRAIQQNGNSKETMETICDKAFNLQWFATVLITLMCAFGTVGYCVLLRDMLEPLQEYFFGHGNVDYVRTNFFMFVVVVLTTPLCTLRTLTALQHVGALSMCSVLILGCCIVIRSAQCNWQSFGWNDMFSWEWPKSWGSLLTAFPLYVSCFVCHYNILPVYNELQNPSPKRVKWWLKSTTYYAMGLYMIFGYAGKLYGNCTKSGHVQGNVLLDFPESDPLLLVGRSCLAITITLAFPLLVQPARDIVIRTFDDFWNKEATTNNQPLCSTQQQEQQQQLQEPLLPTTTTSTTSVEVQNEQDCEQQQQQQQAQTESLPTNKSPLHVRFVVAILVFWSAALVASCVESIDVVWDLLGSSLSMILSYWIPCGCFVFLCQDAPSRDRWIAYSLLAVFVPLMVVSSWNAIHNTFF